MRSGGGNFHVTGSFTYAEEGSYTVQVTMTQTTRTMWARDYGQQRHGHRGHGSGN